MDPAISHDVIEATVNNNVSIAEANASGHAAPAESQLSIVDDGSAGGIHDNGALTNLNNINIGAQTEPAGFKPLPLDSTNNIEPQATKVSADEAAAAVDQPHATEDTTSRNVTEVGLDNSAAMDGANEDETPALAQPETAARGITRQVGYNATALLDQVDFANMNTEPDYTATTVTSTNSQPGPYAVSLKDDLLAALKPIGTSGTFASHWNVSMVIIEFCGIEIDVSGVGIVELVRDGELDALTAQKIIEKSRQISAGRAEEAAVDDETVNTTWELRPEHFSIRGRWGTVLNNAIYSAAQHLGVELGITAELRNMHIYEAGASFKAHTDTAETPNTFGTLVVSLPSDYKGGELVLRHRGKERIIPLSTHATCMDFAYWYSDVSYEILPVTEGYQWVLTYNLISPPHVTEIPSAGLQAARQDLDTKLLRDTLQKWRAEGSKSRHKHVYYELGQYNRSGDHSLSLRSRLSLSSLEAAEQTRVQCLKQMASELKLDIFLAILEKKVKTVGKGTDGGYGYGHDEDGSQDGDEHDDEEGGGGGDDKETETTFRMKSLLDLEDRVLLTDAEFPAEYDCLGNMLQGLDVFDVSHSAFWDRIAVAVIIPRRRTASFLTSLKRGSQSKKGYGLLNFFAERCMSSNPAKRLANLPAMQEMCRRIWTKTRVTKIPEMIKAKALKAALWCRDVEFFNEIIANAKGHTPPSVLILLLHMMKKGDVTYEQVAKSIEHIFDTPFIGYRLQILEALALPVPDSTMMSESFRHLAQDVITKLTSKLMGSCASGRAGQILVDVVVAYHDFGYFSTNLAPLIQRRLESSSPGPAFCLSALARIAKYITKGALPVPEALEVFRRLAKLMVEKFDVEEFPIAEEVSQEPPAKSARYTDYQSSFGPPPADDQPTVRPEVVAGFIEGLITTNSDAIMMQLSFKILAQLPKISVVGFDELWLPFLESLVVVLGANSVALDTPRYQQLFGGVLEAYVDRFVGREPPPIPEADLRRPPLTCVCPDCAAISNFLQSPTQRTARFAGSHSYRSHVEKSLGRARIPCCKDEMQGSSSPSYLLVMKTSETNDLDRREWAERCRKAQEKIRGLGDDKLRLLLAPSDFNGIMTLNHLRLVPVAAPVPGNLQGRTGDLPALSSLGLAPRAAAGIKRPAPDGENMAR